MDGKSTPRLFTVATPLTSRQRNSSEKGPAWKAVKIKRRTETTLESHEIWVIKRSKTKAALWCGQCSNHTQRLTAEEAAKLMNVSTRTIYRWAEAERIHFTEPAHGGLLICFGSLPPQDA